LGRLLKERHLLNDVNGIKNGLAARSLRTISRLLYQCYEMVNDTGNYSWWRTGTWVISPKKAILNITLSLNFVY